MYRESILGIIRIGVKFSTVLIFCAVLNSCSGEEKQDSTFTEINITSGYNHSIEDLFVKDYIDSLKYIILETIE